MNLARFSRQVLLLTLSSAAIWVLGYLLFANPQATRRPPAAFQFPQIVPLAGWQLLQSQPLTATKIANETIPPGWQYRYQRHSQPLNIQLRYIADAQTSSQDLTQLLRRFTQIPPAVIQQSTIWKQPGVGYYRLLTDSNTTYLSACINPQGGSTVTRQQFQQNRLQNDPQLHRLLPWILGQAPLMDHRCLWTLVSLPRSQAAPPATAQALEAVGSSWLRWWQVHFPAR